MEKQLDTLIQTQHKNSEWNFYHERQHVENLFYSRFNFFLVFYGMLITAIATILGSQKITENSIIVLGVLILGILVLLFMQYTLCNVYHTLQIILTLIDALPSYHSSPIISSLRNRGNTGIIIAFVIPSFCIAFLYFILDHIMNDYCCGSTTLYLWFVASTIIIWLFNLYTAIRAIFPFCTLSQYRKLIQLLQNAEKSATSATTEQQADAQQITVTVYLSHRL